MSNVESRNFTETSSRRMMAIAQATASAESSASLELVGDCAKDKASARRRRDHAFQNQRLTQMKAARQLRAIAGQQRCGAIAGIFDQIQQLSVQIDWTGSDVGRDANVASSNNAVTSSARQKRIASEFIAGLSKIRDGWTTATISKLQAIKGESEAKATAWEQEGARAEEMRSSSSRRLTAGLEGFQALQQLKHQSLEAINRIIS